MKFMRFINLSFLKCLILLQAIFLNAQTNKILFSKDLKVKSDSTTHYGTLLLYDDFSSEWIVSSKSNEISKKDSLRDALLKISIKSDIFTKYWSCLLYTSPSPRDGLLSRMPSSA